MRRTNVFKFGDNFNELFDGFFDTFEFEPFAYATEKVVKRALGYRIDENKDSTQLYFELDCPGYSSSDFEVSVSNPARNVLEIKGIKEGDKPKSFTKSFQFGSKWNISKPLECKCENGILYMTFGLKEENKSQRIPVH